MSDKAQQSSTGFSMPEGSPCWIEICSPDPHKLKDFYAALFPTWTFRAADVEASSDTVHIHFEQPSGLTGGFVKLPENCPKPAEQPMGIGSTVYYFVESIDETQKKVESLGGIMVIPKKAESKHGYYANFKDPEGNRFGVYEYRMEG